MHIERLNSMQRDLEGTAEHLEALSRLLEGHARYLRHANSGDATFIETRLNGLTASVVDLRCVAQRIGKVA